MQAKKNADNGLIVLRCAAAICCVSPAHSASEAYALYTCKVPANMNIDCPEVNGEYYVSKANYNC